HRAHRSHGSVREPAGERVHPWPAVGFALTAPRVGLLVEAAAGRVLPLGLRGQAASHPLRVRARIALGDVRDGVGCAAGDRARGAGRPAGDPARSGPFGLDPRGPGALPPHGVARTAGEAARTSAGRRPVKTSEVPRTSASVRWSVSATKAANWATVTVVVAIAKGATWAVRTGPSRSSG